MVEDHVCLFCGGTVARTGNDPCSAVLSVAEPGEPDEAAVDRGGRRRPAWWRRPPGQYWMHASCLRAAAHPSVPLHFLDVAGDGA
jgi:hypothetical protein